MMFLTLQFLGLSWYTRGNNCSCVQCYRLHMWALLHLCDVTTGTGICWGDCRRLQTRLSLPCPPASGLVTFRMPLAENPSNFPARNPSRINWKATGTQAGTRSPLRVKWQGCVLCDGMESAGGVQRRRKNEETSLHSCKWWSCATSPKHTHTETASGTWTSWFSRTLSWFWLRQLE